MSEQIESLDDFRRKLGRANGRRAWPALVEHARRMRANYPEEWEPDYYEARGLIESGHYEEAEHKLLLAMDRFPRAVALAVLFGESGTRRLGPEDSIDRWRSLLLRLPDVPHIHMGLAHAYSASDKPDDAARVVQAALQRLPNSVELLQNRAELDWARQDWPAALESWSAVHAVSPEHPTAATFMIRALGRLNRADEADTLARAEMATRPDDVELAVSYATVAQHAGDPAEAVRRWRAVTVLAPSYPFGALGLARALSAHDELAEADAALAEGLRYNPDHVALLSEYATLAGKAAKWDLAADRWRVVYDRAPAQAKIYIDYIKALELAGRLGLADEIASEAVGFAPDNPALHRRYAGLAALRGDNIEAQRRWEDAASRFPDDAAMQNGMRKAQKAVARDALTAASDEEIERKRTPNSSLGVPRGPEGPARIPQVGPTALDLLMTGRPAGAMAIAAPQPTGWAALRQKLRRAFGRA